jgi:hypothetical protein
MTMSSLLDAYDTVAHSDLLLERLNSAFAELTRKQGLHDEKEWITAAITRVTAAREGLGDLLTRVMRLPEMEPAREEHARGLQNLAVELVERLQAGITFHAGSRAPLLEALFGKVKLPVLRRLDRADFEKFCTDFEKRLNSGYAKRMFAEPSLALVQPVVDQVRASFATWRGAFSAEALEESEARNLRDELDACARRLELPMKQARLLAEAALSPLRDLFEELGLGQKPRKRSLRPAVTETDGQGDEPPADEDDAGEDAEAAPVPAPEPAPEAEAVAPKRRPRAKAPPPDDAQGE